MVVGCWKLEVRGYQIIRVVRCYKVWMTSIFKNSEKCECQPRVRASEVRASEECMGCEK